MKRPAIAPVLLVSPAIVLAALLASPALAQQQIDPVKLGSAYRQQRDIANDAIAACAVQVGDLTAEVQRIKAELEKQEKMKEQ